MTNEQLLLQIGRMVGDTVREAMKESEERLELHVHSQVQASEERMKLHMQLHLQASEERLSKKIEEVQVSLRETDDRLSRAIESLNESVRHSMEDTEKMAMQIVALVERIEGIEEAAARSEI